MKLIQYIFYLTKNLFYREKIYKTIWVDEIPDNLSNNIFYIVGNKKYPFLVVSKCPRKICNKLVQVNILNNKEWELTEHKDQSISLSPSVWLTRDCRCHYFVENGKIRWCDQLRYKDWLKTKTSVLRQSKSTGKTF